MPQSKTKRLHCVLIVEDDDLIRFLAVTYLNEVGFKVMEALNADHALQSLELSGNPVDLVFSDIQMPGKMDGIELAYYLLRKYPQVPVILTSGAKCPPVAAKHHRFVAKPYQLAEIEKHIRELVT